MSKGDDWREDAACTGVGPEWFFPEDGASARPAKSICATCPVAAQCLQEALDNDIQWGVWGGLNLKQRRQLKRSGMVA